MIKAWSANNKHKQRTHRVNKAAQVMVISGCDSVPSITHETSKNKISSSDCKQLR
jgi:hypothetical protein